MRHLEHRRAAPFRDLSLCALGYRGSGCIDFDASRFATTTNWSAVVDADVAAFAGGARTAMVDFAVEHNPRADPSANRHIKNVVIAATRSPSGLGKCRCISVIV